MITFFVSLDISLSIILLCQIVFRFNVCFCDWLLFIVTDFSLSFWMFSCAFSPQVLYFFWYTCFVGLKLLATVSTNTKHQSNAGLLLVHRLWPWPGINPTISHYLVSAEMLFINGKYFFRGTQIWDNSERKLQNNICFVFCYKSSHSQYWSGIHADNVSSRQPEMIVWLCKVTEITTPGLNLEAVLIICSCKQWRNRTDRPCVFHVTTTIAENNADIAVKVCSNHMNYNFNRKWLTKCQVSGAFHISPQGY